MANSDPSRSESPARFLWHNALRIDAGPKQTELCGLGIPLNRRSGGYLKEVWIEISQELNFSCIAPTHTENAKYASGLQNAKTRL
jgi:hypothetical protein